MQLPSSEPFKDISAPPGANDAPAYRSTFDAGKLMQSAKKELSQDDEAYAAFLLALGAGLRRGEIEHLCWRNVDRQQSKIDVTAGVDWTPKNSESEAAVFVDPGLIAELEAFRSGADDLVTTPPGIDRVVAWLRSKGIKGHKPLHTLRKEFGAIINQAADIYTASKQLRHSSINTTAEYYIDNRKRIAPNIGNMLANKQEVKQ